MRKKIICIIYMKYTDQTLAIEVFRRYRLFFSDKNPPKKQSVSSRKVNKSWYMQTEVYLIFVAKLSQRYLCKEVGTLFHRPRSGVTINSFGSRTLIVVSHLGNQSANYKSNIIGRQAQCPCSIAFVKGTRCAWTRRLHRSRKQNTEQAGKTESTVFFI